GVRIELGDYVERQLAERIDKAELVGDVVEQWLKIAERRRTIVFAISVSHSVHIRDGFREVGILAEHLDGGTPTEEREAILAKLAAGTIEVVTNCAVLTEGFDAPDVGALVLARPTKSLGLYFQMLGRGLRPAAGKTDCIVLDHAGAVFQHGFPDDPITWTLNEDQRAENKAHAARGTYKAPALTTCQECHAVKFEGRPCTVCGWQPRPRPRPIVVADGDLGRVSRDSAVKAAIPSVDERLRFYRQL